MTVLLAEGNPHVYLVDMWYRYATRFGAFTENIKEAIGFETEESAVAFAKSRGWGVYYAYVG